MGPVFSLKTNQNMCPHFLWCKSGIAKDTDTYRDSLMNSFKMSFYPRFLPHLSHLMSLKFPIFTECLIAIAASQKFQFGFFGDNSEIKKILLKFYIGNIELSHIYLAGQ